MSFFSRNKKAEDRFADNQIEVVAEEIIANHKTKQEAVKYLMKRYKINFTKAFDIADKVYKRHKKNERTCSYTRSLNNDIKGE